MDAKEESLGRRIAYDAAALLEYAPILAIAWPPSKPPILVAAYTWGSTASTERLSDVLAQAARLVLHDLAIEHSAGSGS